MTDAPHIVADSAPRVGADGLILEGLVTTLDVDGAPHLAPMGPIVDSRMERLWLRPFQSSATFANLKRAAAGVFHVTDDVELLAHAAIRNPNPLPRCVPAGSVPGVIVADACRWYAFEVEAIDEAESRANVVARIVDRGQIREFFGFNRAKHAVVEAAILATRVHLIDAATLQAEFERLALPVVKTGAAAERRAFDLLCAYVSQSPASKFASEPHSTR